MTRNEALARISAVLPRLSDERVQVLAELAREWADETARPTEDEATRSAIAEGIEQGRRGEFASDEEVTAAFARFRK